MVIEVDNRTRHCDIRSLGDVQRVFRSQGSTACSIGLNNRLVSYGFGLISQRGSLLRLRHCLLC